MFAATDHQLVIQHIAHIVFESFSQTSEGSPAVSYNKKDPWVLISICTVWTRLTLHPDSTMWVNNATRLVLLLILQRQMRRFFIDSTILSAKALLGIPIVPAMGISLILTNMKQ